MKGFKIIIIAIFLTGFVYCKKENKENSNKVLLENGKYGLLLTFEPGSETNKKYYILDNSIYPIGNSIENKDSICFDRLAGSIFSESEKLKFSPIEMITDIYTPCVFYSDIIGGDTFKLHLSNYTESKDINLKKYYSGDFYYFVPLGLPYKRLEGKFKFEKYWFYLGFNFSVMKQNKGNLIFRGANLIELNEGFEVDINGEFFADVIGGCDAGY